MYDVVQKLLTYYLNILIRYYSNISKYKYKYHLNIDSEGISIYLIESDAKAMVQCFCNEEDKCMYISSLSVDEDMRRNGIADTLLQMSENIAAFLFRDVELWVAYNTWMIGWYKRKGYKLRGFSKGYMEMRKHIQHYIKK